MKTLSMNKLSDYLGNIIDHNIQSSLMIWGAPGIGKSSVVDTVAKSHDLDLIDLRISQLAPTDLRGIPVPKNDKACWYPPEFLPTSGKGILFLDEINMAPPAVQGIAQQLILDRKVGSYKVPEGWFIWSAGNRKEDFAAVYDMPAPLANRFIHLEVKTGLEEFKNYALKNNIDDRIISFLNFRPNYLHKIDKTPRLGRRLEAGILEISSLKLNLILILPSAQVVHQNLEVFVKFIRVCLIYLQYYLAKIILHFQMISQQDMH